MLEQLTIEFIAFSLIGILGVAAFVLWGVLKKGVKSALTGKPIINTPISYKDCSIDKSPTIHSDFLQDKPFYATALSELEQGNVDKGTWARALSESLGKEQEARALYIRFRVSELKPDPVYNKMAEEEFIGYLRILARTPIADADSISSEQFDSDPDTLGNAQSVSSLSDKSGLLEFQIIDLIKTGLLKGVRYKDEWFVDSIYGR